MTTTNEKAADVDVQFLQAKIRGLENEVRDLRETLWDKYAMAAIAAGNTPLNAKAIADKMIDERVKT